AEARSPDPGSHSLFGSILFSRTADDVQTQESVPGAWLRTDAGTNSTLAGEPELPLLFAQRAAPQTNPFVAGHFACCRVAPRGIREPFASPPDARVFGEDAERPPRIEYQGSVVQPAVDPPSLLDSIWLDHCSPSAAHDLPEHHRVRSTNLHPFAIAD